MWHKEDEVTKERERERELESKKVGDGELRIHPE
jgi:hypothetical protein